MTKINKLVIHGFKSFANRTELLFGDDFNCVLGPNGSGKSNILDALCFVLGRLGSKSLRAEKTANLVYNGGKTKKPMKQGEVSIFFDNEKKTFPTEDPFVKITRIIKKDGQSVYKINDQKRTRQQILDLMSIARIDPDGYNIILQGDIVKFTEMHPEERRILIEDISGISVYEEKKHKALRELEKVEERLKEAGIILAERAAHLRELKKERDQALKFKELESKIKENKASYLYIQIERKEKRKESLTKQINEHKEEINKINNNVNNIKQLIQEKRDSILNINREIEEKAEKEQVSLQRSIEQLKIQLATSNQRAEHCKNEIEKIELRKTQLKKSLEDIDNEINELNSKKEEINKNKDSKLEELNKVERTIKGFKENNSIEDAAEIEKETDSIDKNIEEKQKEIEELRKNQQDFLRKKDNLDFQINNIDDQMKKVLNIEKEHKDQIEDLKNKKEDFKKSIVELNQRLTEDGTLSVQISEKKQNLAKSEENLAKLNARRANIRENIAGNVAIKKILEQNKKGVHGTIAELGNVSEEYALALEVAAGPRMNSIVVEDDKVAADCIKHLKEKKFGTATFLPLNKIKTRIIDNELRRLSKEDSVKGFAVDLISFDERFKKAFSYVFGSTLVVENIDVARNIGVGKARMVTADGDLTEISGAMQGGYRQKKRFGFQHKEVIKEIDEQKVNISEIEKTISKFSKRREENEFLIHKLREKKANLEGDIIKQEKSLHLEDSDLEASKNKKEDLRKGVNNVKNELEKIEENIDEINKELTDSKIKKQELRSKINELRNPSLMAELNAFEEKKIGLKEEGMEISNGIKAINTEIDDLKEPEKERINQILKTQAKEAEDFNQEITELRNTIENKKKVLEENEKKSQEFYIKNKEMIAKKDRLGDEIQEEESKIEGKREGSKEIEIKMNEVSLKNAEVNAKLAGLNEEFQQFEGVKINKDKNEEELKGEINKFEKMVNEIGSVNMRALEIYEGIEREYNSLLAKKESLFTEKGDVEGMMGEIEGKKKELFMKTFDLVNENFKNIFAEISAKGEASLELENQDNPFEAGLSVKVRLVGKKFLDIRSLSGGEKTMTALAFIFAIQEYDPHSFYILDEVDAALDKHNSEKLAKLVRKYVGKAQYILISHNDAVISEANTLYGVSMNEHGISQVTSLKI